MDTEDVLLEREAQLAALASYAGEARKAQGRLVLVAGEAGVGKSALVEELQRDLPEAAWFWGACDGLFTPRPLGPLFDIAAKLGGELLDLCRADAPREELFGALLRQVSEPGALHVLVVEDIHWADEATIDLLRFLGRRIRDATVLLIVTYRDDGPDRQRIRSASRWAIWPPSGPSGASVSGPLSADATAVLAGGCGLDAAALLPADRRQPVLRDRGRAVRDGRGATVGPGRGAGPGGPAERRRPRGAGRRGADRHPGRVARCWRRSASTRRRRWMSCSHPGCWAAGQHRT